VVNPVIRIGVGLAGETIHGGLAERCRVPVHQLTCLPDSLRFTAAAALSVADGTVWRMMLRIRQI